MAVAFDIDRLEVRGQPVPVVANVMHALNATNAPYNTGAGQYNVSYPGSLIYVSGGILPDNANSLVRLDMKGNVQPIADFEAAFFAPRFSPDGQRISYSTNARERRVWIFDVSRGTTTQLTGEGLATWAIWMPNGKRLVFGWAKSGMPNLWWRASDGSSPMEQLAADAGRQHPGSFTPDGSMLAFVDYHPQPSDNILLLDMKTRGVTAVLTSKAREIYPEISPDGRWLAYASNESGRMEIFMGPFPGLGGKWQISNAGGTEPIWSKDGKQLFYRRSAQVWVVGIRTEGGFYAGRPHLLFEQRGLGFGDPIRNWDLAPDGRSFLMVKSEETKPEPVTEMVLVQNWFEELKRLCPTGK